MHVRVADRVLTRPRRRARSLGARLYSPARQYIRPRRIDVCCCGLSKTGTHSLAGLFDGFRSRHHADADLRLRLCSEALDGVLDPIQAQAILRRRDRRLWLEMDSSSLVGILIEHYLAACPDKRVILTMRDVFSWCDSWIDHNLMIPPEPSSPWTHLDRKRLRVDDVAPTRHDEPLLALGFPPLPCFFQLWTTHNETVLRAVPGDRLLIVRTSEILERLDRIAAFAGVPSEALKPERGWLFASTKKHHVLANLDPEYVAETAARMCGPLMERFFPEVSLQPNTDRVSL